MKASLYHETVCLYVILLRGDEKQVKYDRTDDARYEGKTPFQCALKEVRRQEMKAVKMN
jgi:hypothetical protein